MVTKNSLPPQQRKLVKRLVLLEVKDLLREEETIEDMYEDENNLSDFDRGLSVKPALQKSGEIILQFHSWSINLLENGTWIWKATDGE